MINPRRQDHHTGGPQNAVEPADSTGHDGGRELRIVVCCMAMPALAVILVASGVVGVGFLVIAAAAPS